jgi:hypothetical protein
VESLVRANFARRNSRNFCSLGTRHVRFICHGFLTHHLHDARLELEGKTEIEMVSIGRHMQGGSQALYPQSHTHSVSHTHLLMVFVVLCFLGGRLVLVFVWRLFVLFVVQELNLASHMQGRRSTSSAALPSLLRWFRASLPHPENFINSSLEPPASCRRNLEGNGTYNYQQTENLGVGM